MIWVRAWLIDIGYGARDLSRATGRWLGHVYLGPACPLGCGHRARGHRTLTAHLYTRHAGDDLPQQGEEPS